MSEENTQPDSINQVEKHKQPARGGGLALLLSLLAISSLGAVMWLGYPHWQGMRQDMISVKKRMESSFQIQSELKTSLDNAYELIQQSPSSSRLTEQQAALDAQQHLLSKTQTAMEQREVALRATIAELRKRTGKPDNRWMVAEAEYLLQLAQARLRLAGDSTTAIAAIQQARQRLLETGDEQWADILHLLTRDAEKLAAIMLPDLKQLSADISSLVARIPGLQPTHRKPIARDANTVSATDTAEKTTDKNWQTLVQTLANNILDAIRIRRHDQPPAALIAPEQELLLYQNLELILETARLALMQRNTPLFRDNLRRAGQWISKRFDADQETAVSMLSKLDQLAQLNLNPELPDINPSLQALRARKSLLSNQP